MTVTATVTPLSKATPQQRRLIAAWRKHATLKGAAAELGITRNTAKNHVTDLCERTGARGLIDLVYWLGIEEAALGQSSTDLAL